MAWVGGGTMCKVPLKSTMAVENGNFRTGHPGTTIAFLAVAKHANAAKMSVDRRIIVERACTRVDNRAAPPV